MVETYQNDISFTTASVTQTASDALNVDSDRTFILIQNIGANTIWFRFGGTAVASTGGFKLAAGDVLVLDNDHVHKNLSVICETGETSTLAIQAD